MIHPLRQDTQRIRSQARAVHELASTSLNVAERFDLQLKLGNPSSYLILILPFAGVVVRFSNHPHPGGRCATDSLRRQMPVEFLDLYEHPADSPETILQAIRVAMIRLGASPVRSSLSTPD